MGPLLSWESGYWLKETKTPGRKKWGRSQITLETNSKSEQEGGKGLETKNSSKRTEKSRVGLDVWESRKESMGNTA